MKKLFFTTAATTAITIATLITSQVSAASTYNDREYWTFDEMVAFSKEVKPEWTSFCENGEYDWECEFNYPIELYEWFHQDEKHFALELFEWSSFVITSFNPSKNTIKIYYDPNLSGSELDDLLVVWFDGEPDYLYQNNIKNDQKTANTHLLIEYLDPIDPMIFPLSTEMEFQMIDYLDPNEDSYHQIYYNFQTREHGRTSGTYDYSDCVNSPYYQDGMECRAVFSENGIFYLPVQPITESTTINPTETIPDLGESNSIELEIVESNPELIEPDPIKSTSNLIEPEIIKLDPAPIDLVPISASPEPEPVLNTSNLTPTHNVATALSYSENITKPDTKTTDGGYSDDVQIPVPTANGETRQVKDTPIWIISLVIFICSGIILWFFLPGKHQKSPKTPKK